MLHEIFLGKYVIIPYSQLTNIFLNKTLSITHWGLCSRQDTKSIWLMIKTWTNNICTNIYKISIRPISYTHRRERSERIPNVCGFCVNQNGEEEIA